MISNKIKNRIILSILTILFVLTLPLNKDNFTIAFPVSTDDNFVMMVSSIRPLGPSRPSFENLPQYVQNEIRCLAHNIYFEARSEPTEGKMAVAHVTLNRVNSPMFPKSICDVVKQQRNKTCQFSWWCDAKLRAQSINNMFSNKDLYNEIKELAIHFVLNREQITDITEGALFYHAVYVNRNRLGSMPLVPTITIGQHAFYRM